MEFRYRAGHARNPSTGAAATSVNSESAATRVQGDYGGDGSAFHGENSEAVAPRPASDQDELRRRAAKERIRERILREEAETLALEAEVRRELMEERIPSLRRSAGACDCTKGPEAKAAPAAISSSLKMLIGHEVSSKVNGSAACLAKGKNPNVAAACTFFAATSSNEQKPDFTCTMCGITSTSQKAMQDHLEGKLHRRKAATLAQPMSKEDVVCSKPNASAAAALLPAKRKISRVVTAASTISAAASSKKEKQGLTSTLCGITATGEKGMQDHLKGKAHMRNVAALAQPLPGEAVEHGRQEETEEEGAYMPRKFNLGTNSGTIWEVVQMNGYLLCEVCYVKTADKITMRCHLEGHKHISKAKKQEEQSQAVVAATEASVHPEIETVAVEVNAVRRVDGFLLCEFCNVKAASETVMRSHMAGKKHASKQKAAVDAGAGGKAVLAQAKTDKDVAVGTFTVTTEQQAKKTEAAATVGDSNKLVVLGVGGVQHVVEKVGRFLLCSCCKVKAPSECVMRSHLLGKKHMDKAKRAVLAEAKYKEAASVVVDGTGRTEGQGNDESMEKTAVPSATPQQDAAAPVFASFSVASMEVDERAGGGDDTTKAEGEKVDAEEEEAVKTNGVAAMAVEEVKIQVEGKVFTVLRQLDSSLSCGLCGVHGCDKGRMVKHLYTREHWHRARLSEQNEEQARKAAQAVVSNDSDGAVIPVTDGAGQVKK